MIKAVRALTQTFAAKFIIALIIISMSFWGIGSIFLNSNKNEIMTIGNKSIQFPELKSIIDQQIERMRSVFGPNFNINMAWQIGLVDKIIRELMMYSAIEVMAEDLGMYVSQDYIVKLIKEDKIFYTNNKFDQEKFITILKNNNLNQNKYSELLSNEIIKSRIINAIASSAVISNTTIESVTNFNNNVRDAEFIKINSKNIKIPAPSTEQLQNLYNENISIFQYPESKDIQYLLMSYNNFYKETKAKVSRQKLQNFFNSRRNSYIKQTNKYGINYSFETREACKSFLDLLVKFTSSKTAFQKLSDKNRKELIKINIEFAANMLPTNVMNAVKDLPINGHSTCVALNDRYSIFVIKKIEKARKQTFWEAYKKIKEDYLSYQNTNNKNNAINQLSEITKSLYKIVNQYSDKKISQKQLINQFNQLSKQNNIKFTKFNKLQANGDIPTDIANLSEVNTYKIINYILSKDTGEVSNMKFEEQNGTEYHLFFTVTNTNAKGVISFAKAKSQLKKIYYKKIRQSKTKEMAEAIKKNNKSLYSISKMNKAFIYKRIKSLDKPKAYKLLSPKKGFPNNLPEDLFYIADNDKHIINDNEKTVVARIIRIIPTKHSQEDKDRTRESLTNDLYTDIISAFAQDIQNQYNYNINRKLIGKLLLEQK